MKELKSRQRPEELPTRQAQVEALVLASLIALLVGRRLIDAVRARRPRRRQRIRTGCWAALFAAVSAAILDVLSLPANTPRVFQRPLEPMLLHEALDPKATRLGLLQRVGRGLAWVR